VPFSGFDAATFTNAPNAGAIFVPLLPFHEPRPRASAPINPRRTQEAPGAIQAPSRSSSAAAGPRIGNAAASDVRRGPARARDRGAGGAVRDLAGAANQTPA